MVVAITTLALTGACGDASKDEASTAASGKASTAPSLSPTDALAASVKGFSATPYAYSVKNDMFTYGGSADPANGKVLLDGSLDFVGVKMTIEGRIDGKDWYAKVDPGPEAFQGKWLHLDPAKLKDPTGLGFQDVKDPARIQQVAPALTATEKTADGKIKGTLDLGRISGEVLYLDPTDVTALGDKAKTVPFQATLDGSGRLTGLAFEIPGTDGDAPAPVTYTFSDWGKAVTVEKPAGAIEADQAVYKYFDMQI
ncbi:hypothetical protein [Dactylosporangium sp. CA-233914]|uniref:hypothetical protein n=1 Tax=Dactylosporangium sp. CA-233914 TaxID=3239934 RepID=UPI003D8BD99C